MSMVVADSTRRRLREHLLFATEDEPAHRGLLDRLFAAADDHPLDMAARWSAVMRAGIAEASGVDTEIAAALTADALWLTVSSFFPNPSLYGHEYLVVRDRRRHPTPGVAMPSYDRTERVTRTVEYHVPTYTSGACWTEVYKAVAAIHSELVAAGELLPGKDAADDRIRITGTDEAIIISYEVRDS